MQKRKRPELTVQQQIEQRFLNEDLRKVVAEYDHIVDGYPRQPGKEWYLAETRDWTVGGLPSRILSPQSNKALKATMAITVELLETLVARVEADQSARTMMLLSQRLSVALVLDRVDWLREEGYRTLLEAREFLGRASWKAVQDVKRSRRSI